MNEKQFGFQIKQTLNRGLGLDEQVLDRLKTARLQALEKQQIEAPALAFATARIAGHVNGDTPFVSARTLLPLAMLIIGLFASNHWYQSQLQEEIIEIDTEVLTGDLPMDAYLDKGFDAWLKRSSD